MAEDANIGRRIMEHDLISGGEFYLHEPSGTSIFPVYCADGSISSRSCVALWVDGKLTTYEVDRNPSDIFRGKGSLTIVRKIGVDNG